MHLLVDGYGGDPELLKDEELIYRFLDEHPAVIGMTKIQPPKVHIYRGKSPEDWGVSGFVLIAESHISIHTFPDRRYVNVDIFSCKDFDADRSVEDLKSGFSLKEVNSLTLERGLEYADGEASHAMVQTRGRIA